MITDQPIVGTWQHRVSPGVVPVIVGGAAILEEPGVWDLVPEPITEPIGDHIAGLKRAIVAVLDLDADVFDLNDSDEEFDTPLVTIHEDAEGGE